MKINTYLIIIITIIIFVLPYQISRADDGPWRLKDIMPAPAWISISGQHRIRFENLDEQFRGTRGGGDQVLLVRTLLLAELDFKMAGFTAEMMDSRAYFADEGTPLSTSFVNPLELLQAYIEIPIDDLFLIGSKSMLRGGRITMDIGSRRLVARNRFRNTINAFTGIDWQLISPGNNQLRIFYTFPVQRRVSGNILDNDARFDKEYGDVRFWGAYFAMAELPWKDKGEIYFFGLDEDDVSELPTANRDLYTSGFRVYREPVKQRFSYQIESVFQFGESRRSTSGTDTADLDHFAFFQHAEIGYLFDARWSPELLFQYDYASGDDDLADLENERFDTLYGARRFDFGPTSIYGPFARSNISSPGVRLKFKPSASIKSFIALRGFWLASADDAWVTARISNVVGVSDSYIGTQIEGRFQWEVVPGNVIFETGAAYLHAGDIMDNADKDNASYVYSQLSIKF